jgi:hypothetical protein
MRAFCIETVYQGDKDRVWSLTMATQEFFPERSFKKRSKAELSNTGMSLKIFKMEQYHDSIAAS